MSTTAPVVVITGASAGVGRATARAFAARGARIGLVARNVAALEAARAEVDARGGQAVVAIADVADPDAVERAAQAIVANAFAPGILDRYLGRIGYDQQQGDEPEQPGRPDNLYNPVPGDAGAHGMFSE